MFRMMLAMALVIGVGCNNKIKRYANNIEAMSVHPANAAGPPLVSLGRVEVTDEASASEAGAAAGGNVVLEAFEVELMLRLQELINPAALAENAGAMAAQRMGNQGPYPVDPSSRWELHVAVDGWGIHADVDEPAAAWMNVDASAYGPKGKRIWRRHVSCHQDLVGYLPGATDVTQAAMNIGMIRSMDDPTLLRVFEDLSTQCARTTVDKLNRTISKAKARG